MLIKLTESISLDKSLFKELPLTESKSLIESIDGKEHKAIGVYNVKVSRYDNENLNGRIYTKKLWENVINKQKHLWDGCVGLLDHPKEEGSTKDIFCVWHNLTLDESDKTVKADMYLVGSKGKDIKEVLDAGGLIGLSSSGLGELKEDNKTVNEDSFSIERLADCVFNPSQYVFATKEDIKSESTQNKQTEAVQIDIKEKLDENKETIMNKTVSIPVNLLRKNIEGYLETAFTITDLNTRLSTFKEIEDWVDDSGSEKLNDLKEKIVNEIKAILDKKEELSIKGQKTDSLAENLEKTNILAEDYKNKLYESIIKLDLAYSHLDNLKSYSNKYKEMFDIASGKLNTMVEAEDFVKANKELSKVISEKKELSLQITKLKEQKEDIKAEFELFVEKVKDQKEAQAKRIAEMKQKKLDIEAKEILMLKKAEKIEEQKQLQAELLKEQELDYLQQRTEVKEYYRDLCKIHSSKVMENFKDNILECRTLESAQIRYFKLRNKIEEATEEYKQDDTRIYESFKKEETKSWTPKKRINSLL